MPSPRLITPLLSAVAALSLAVVGGLAPDAGARAPKSPAPELTIDSKVCAIGPTPAERSATVTASAIIGDDGDRVSMKFAIQQRANAKAKWKATPGAAKSGLGGWETGQAGRAGLRYTKTINGLAEGTQYRVVVDVRGVSEAGKVVTRSARRYVSCTQPLFTPTLQLVKAVDAPTTGSAHEVTVSVRNAGRLPTDSEGTVTVYDAATRAVLATGSLATAQKGGSTEKVVVPLTTCPGQLYVTVQPTGADIAALTPEQSTTLDCKATQSRNRPRG